MRIRSYPIPIEDRFEIDLPEHARILTVCEQRGQARLWTIVDPNAPVERRSFHLIANDRSIEFELDSCNYVGTFQAGGGVLVFHVFIEHSPALGDTALL